MARPVKLLIYDLSQGMARQFSSMMPGMPSIVPHTSVVVDGTEWYFGGGEGISSCRPGAAPYGQPIQELEIGGTHLSREDFLEVIDSMRSEYTPHSYSLLDRNCNNFSNDLCNFISGRSIPDWILTAPQDFMASPLGQSLRPMIDQMYQGGNQAASRPDAAQAVPALASAATTNGSGPGNHGLGSPFSSVRSTQQTDRGTPEPLILATSLPTFRQILNSNTAVIAFFTSVTCGPCRVVEPTFSDLAWKHTPPEKASRVAFVKLDLSGAGQEIGQAFGVRATPTFVFWQNGKEKNRFSGADPKRLISETELEILDAFPPHPHTLKRFLEFERLPLKPILFDAKPASLDPLFNKLKSFTISTDVTESDREKLCGLTNPGTERDRIYDGLVSYKKIFNLLADEQLFPAFDILRLGTSAANGSILSQALVKDQDSSLLNVMLARLSKIFGETSFDATKLMATQLTSLKMLTNLFVDDEIAVMMTSSTESSIRSSLTILIRVGLASENEKLRQVGSSLCFNIAQSISRPRRRQAEYHRERRPAHAGPLWCADEGEDEEWQIELVSLIHEAICQEQDRMQAIGRRDAHNPKSVPNGDAAQTISGSELSSRLDIEYRLVASLGCLIYQTPHQEIIQLAGPNVLGITRSLENLIQACKVVQMGQETGLGRKLSQLATEVGDLCR